VSSSHLPIRVIAISLATILLWPPAIVAQEDAARSRAKLAEDFSDPLTTLPQLFMQDVYTPENYGTEAQTNKVILRAIIPRIPEYSLLPFVQLIRPTFQIVTVPTGQGSATRTAFGDIQLFDLAVIPWPPRESGLYMGLGPVFVFPTASDKLAGQNSWQIGPAFGAVYKGLPGFLFGCLIQNPISFAYTSAQARPVNVLLVQPVVLAYLKWGFYVKSADSTWATSWHAPHATTLPLSAGLGYVLLREDWPPINLFVSGEWLAYRHDVPVTPQTTARFGLTIAFPQFSPW
jgi:hypothetical protein